MPRNLTSQRLGWRRRHYRMQRLEAEQRRRALRPAEARELEQLRAKMYDHWRRLPRQIADARAKLADLERYADEIGIGPV